MPVTVRQHPPALCLTGGTAWTVYRANAAQSVAQRSRQGRSTLRGPTVSNAAMQPMRDTLKQTANGYESIGGAFTRPIGARYRSPIGTARGSNASSTTPAQKMV